MSVSGKADAERQLGQTVTRGAAWTHGAFLLGKIVVFGGTVVLARLLLPEDFGLVAIGLMTIAYLDTLSEAGVSAAVVWHKAAPERVAAVAMLVAMVTALATFSVTYLAAGEIAEFFHEPRARPIIEALAISFIFTSPALVLSGLLQRRMQFRRRIVPEIAKSVGKSFVGIGLAVLGFGAWSLVYGHLFGSALALICYWWVSGWRPRLSFDPTMLREILPYGFQLMLIGMLGIAIKNTDYFVIGRFFDARLLGIYFMAFALIEHTVMGFCWAASQSLFPAFSSIDSDLPGLRRFFGQSLAGVAALTLPAGAGIAIVAEPLVWTLFGERWIETIAIIQALAFYAMIYSLGFNLGDIYKAVGRPHILTYISLVNLAVAIPVLLFASHWGIFGVAVGQVVLSLFMTCLNWVIAARVLGIGAQIHWNALRPVLAATGAMSAACLLLKWALQLEPGAAELVLLMLCGAVTYAVALSLAAPGLVNSALGLVKLPPISRPGGAA